MATTPLELQLSLEIPDPDCSFLMTTVDLDVQVLDRVGNPVSGAAVMARNPESKYAFFTKTDSRGRAVVKTPVDGAEVMTIYGGEVHSQTVEIKAGLVSCSSKCVNRKMKYLRRTPHQLTVRLP